MKIAIISDIHGNIQALDRVLNDIQTKKCDRIFCLGDLAMAGPEPENAVQKIYELSKNPNFTIIQGNTDKMIANYTEKLGQETKDAFPIMGNALENDFKTLSESSKSFLKNLPEKLEINVENISILLVHGSPRKNNENIFPNMDLKVIEEIISGTKSDLIFCGHTHIPCGYQTNTKQTVINVGSVGRPFTDTPQACYALVTIENGQFAIEHRLLDYDKEKAAEILSKRDFEGAKKLSNILISPTERHM